MKRDIIAVLVNHKGKDSAITVSEIANRISSQNFGYSCAPIRAIIREIIEDEKLAIGSCVKGYYLIETEEERHEVIDNLTSRVIGIRSRIDLLKRCTI